MKNLKAKLKLEGFFRSIHQKMNQGAHYTEILEEVFKSLETIIPFDRIGIALLDAGDETIRLHWVKSKVPVKNIDKDYSAPLATSSLADVIKTGRPRIINDLSEYYDSHPKSGSSERILRDGVHSNLTCPLIVNGRPIGVIFFSSKYAFTYTGAHVDTFLEIAEGLSLIIEQELLRKALSKTEQKEREFRNAIHDLSNPLTVIQGSLEMIEKRDWFQHLDETQKQVFSMLKRNSDSMGKIIETMIYKKISEGLTERPTVDIDDFLNDLREDCAVMGQSKGITVQITKGPEVPRWAHLNPDILKEAIQNLISNAVKFSPMNSVVTVLADFDTALKTLRFEVTDEGPGIPAEEQPKLFKSFGLTSVKPSAGERSSGHGLASVKDLVEGQSGKVYMRSSVGHGSTFGLEIPAP